MNASLYKERIPIVLNLSSWKKQQTLAEWIADKLSSVYSIPIRLARSWLDKGYLVPLLDSLDEVKTELQADCVEAINEYITQADPPGLVVCSRLMEYQWLPERLKLNGAICIEPLNRKQIDKYFSTVGPEFESLRRAIQEDAVLQELAQSPLMLNIMCMAYQSASMERFADRGHSVEIHRTQIFNAYVDKMFQRKASLGKIFPKEKVIFWLSWLARQMTEHSQSVFFIENLQPSWLDSSKQRFAYREIWYLIVGLIFGLIFGLMFGIIGGFTDKIREDKVLPNQGITLTLKNGIFAGFIAILIGGLIFGLIVGLEYGLIYGLTFGLIVGLSRGLGAVIKHYVLRLVLWLSGKTPFKFIPFLDYCTKLILLKKVGGGYIFIHRMLLEYFADLRTTAHEHKQQREY